MLVKIMYRKLATQVSNHMDTTGGSTANNNKGKSYFTTYVAICVSCLSIVEDIHLPEWCGGSNRHRSVLGLLGQRQV